MDAYLERLDLAYNINLSGDFDPGYTKWDWITKENIDYVIEQCKASYAVAYDYETTGLEIFAPDFELRCLSLTYTPGFSWVLNLDEGANRDLYHRIYSEVFRDPNVIKIAHNLKYESLNDRKFLGPFRGRMVDTMGMSNLYDERQERGLKALVDKFLPQWSGYDFGIDYLGPMSLIAPYAAIDTDATLRLFYHFEKELIQDDKLYTCLRSLYTPGTRAVMTDLEFNGALVSPERIAEKLQKIDKIIVERLEEMNNYPQVRKYVQAQNKQLIKEQVDERNAKIAKRKESGKDASKDSHILRWKTEIKSYLLQGTVLYSNVNFDSPSQLTDLLFGEMGFKFKPPVIDGKPSKSSNAETLNLLDTDFGFKLRAYRTLVKLRDTYLSSLQEKHIDGVIRCNFNQYGARTGRMSSSNPNLQNMPSRVNFEDDELKDVIKSVKRCFVPPQGYKIVQVDFSQAELRMIASVSNDPDMIKAYNEGIDLHAITASRIFDMDLEQFMGIEDYKRKRNIGKTANFGLVYLISDPGYIAYVKTSGQNIGPKEARKHRQAVFGTYKNLDKWHETYINRAEKLGYVRTLFGQKRHLDDMLNSHFPENRSKALRIAVNSPIQGTVGQIMVYAMFWMLQRFPEIIHCNTVHDSVIFYIKDDEKYMETLKGIKECCEDLPITEYFEYFKPLKVNMKVDFEESLDSWGELEEVELV